MHASETENMLVLCKYVVHLLLYFATFLFCKLQRNFFEVRPLSIKVFCQNGSTLPLVRLDRSQAKEKYLLKEKHFVTQRKKIWSYRFKFWLTTLRYTNILF